MNWEKVNIMTPHGSQQGIAPVIISASRSTDIPAFYSKWFMKRLQVGYVKWINPFNREPQFVSFKNTRAIIFWTKNPAPMLPLLSELDSMGYNYYFSYTINDYEEEGLEPGVPFLEERIDTFIKLSNLIGKEKVIWRFDPLVLTETLDINKLLNKIKYIGDRLFGYTEKLVISFVDISEYKKVQKNLLRVGVQWKNFSGLDVEKISEGLESLNKIWGFEISTCGERIDLSKYGISKNSCIDGELMARVFNNDVKLLEFLGVDPFEQFNLFESKSQDNKLNLNEKLKDKGQRLVCGCIASKDIGQYDTCKHLCIYCYANTSEKVVNKNYFHHQIEQETIVFNGV